MSEPSAKQASAKPPCAREPCSSAKAGMQTSTTPKATPSANDARMIVRTAADPSAPARERERGDALGRAHRRGEREPERADRAQRGRHDDGRPGRRDHGHCGDDQRADDEEQLLQPGLERVGGVAQLLRRQQARPERAHAGADRRQRRAHERGARDQRERRGRRAIASSARPPNAAG